MAWKTSAAPRTEGERCGRASGELVLTDVRIALADARGADR